ncbi:SusC/RagA family TonB-linked outer membrane protein [Lacibacter luteus]|uniref:SusC/RagA family TonB-linked outer membrane protein n=1 Tax=Lacibacter luteus TaxID=2508719 RepID=A0A4Q1CP74_9BACT|nr:SusC/RagA family TonB-linked outer membrane protein [Lacibacter luteus]
MPNKKTILSLLGRKATKAATLAIAVLLQLLFFTGSANAQNVTVKGKVTNEQGSPVEGASVVVKGTTNGTTTDNTGSFTISVQRNAVLVISAINFSDKEVVVTDANINVKLEPLEKSLGEVVVIGYGTQRKIDVTGAVASVNLEARRDLPMTNVGQVLQGTVPGLNVGLSTVSGGTPPISIRGRVTLSGNQNVLIILDGIQYTGSLSSINPDDIATIDVLKDASSTAVYGAQAANGVILITSKKGRKSEKPRLSFSSSYTVQQPTIGDLRPFDRDGFIKFMTENFYDKAYLAPGYTQPNPSFRLQDWIDPVLGTPTTGLQPHNYDWFDEATKNGSIYEANLSISGGSDRFTYFLSGALVDQKGYIINDNFKRKTIRANLETKPLSWWKVGVVSSASFVNQDGAEPSFGSIQRMPPLLRPYDSTGTLIPFPTRTLEPSPFTTYYVDDVERNNYYFANIYTDINFPFLKGLNYRMNFGNNYRESKRFFASIYAAGQTGQAFKNYQNYYDYTFDNILTYKNTFGKHDVTATLLYGAIERQFNSTNSRAEGFTRLNLSYNNLSLGTNRFTESSANAEALNYQMARVNYKFNDRYLLTGTIRRDGFSGFSKNFKYGVFPVVALGWVVSEEKFMKNIKAINSLKLRAGYGVNGNQTAQYTSIARVETNTSYIYGDGGTTAFGQQVSSLGNDNLEWERTAGLNIGVDFGLLKQNRLTGSLEFYKNKTTDLLYSINIPNVTGFGSIRTNVGQIDNTGFEAAINYNIIRAKDFKWDANLNFSANINKIVTIRGIDANGDGIEDDLISSGLFIGKAIGTIYDYQLDGIYQLTDTRLPGFPVGSLRIVDQNKDNDITQAADRIVLGRREPAYRVSLGNTFSYKGFSLFVFVNSVQGGKNGYLGNNNPSYFREDNTIRINDLMGIDYWSPNNPNGKYPRNVSGTRAKFEPSYWQDRSFIRLQDVTLSYNFSKLLKKLPVETISAFVSGRNLYTWTNWEGWDPETEAADANGVLQAQGLLIGGRPVLRTFTFGVNLVF